MILVHKKTQQREAIKIGITKGTSYRDALVRASGFKGYEIRIQKLVKGTLEEVFWLENYLHELWAHKRLEPQEHFGGHTECFEMDDEIIRSIPKNSS